MAVAASSTRHLVLLHHELAAVRLRSSCRTDCFLPLGPHRIYRRSRQLICRSEADRSSESPSVVDLIFSKDMVSVKSTTSEPADGSSDQGLPPVPNKDLNRRIALVSTVSAIGLFLSTRLEFGISLKDLSALAVPYEEALSNGMPTVVEFYADWCEVCRELAPDVYKVEQQFKDHVNFVMLNVDNTKWEQELDEYGVEGIPHFVFLDRLGNEEGNIVGRLPGQYLLENVAALADGRSKIPHARVVGQYSSAESRKVSQVPGPLSHG